jgi:hypothetical protein
MEYPAGYKFCRIPAGLFSYRTLQGLSYRKVAPEILLGYPAVLPISYTDTTDRK